MLEHELVSQGIAEGLCRSGLAAPDAAAGIRALIDGISLQWLFRPEETFDAFRDRLTRSVYRYLGL